MTLKIRQHRWVCPPPPCLVAPTLTDSRLLDAIVREFTPIGEFSAFGLYLKCHVFIYVALIVSGSVVLSYLTSLFEQRADDQFILKRDWTKDQPD